VTWPLDLPQRSTADWWARKAAAWSSHLLPPEIIRAVPAVSNHPQGAALTAGYWMRAVLTARKLGMHTLALSAVIPRPALDGLLPPEEIGWLRALEIPVDTTTPDDYLRRRLEELREVGPVLPVRYPQ
jgi:hypothetical protein